MTWKSAKAVCVVLILSGSVPAAESVGERPYEMVRANRTHDTRPPLLDFEDSKGWTVECQDTVATFQRSREQPLWGKSAGKLTYRADGKKPTVTLRLPEPAAVPKPFDCVTLWIYGNNWGWAPDASTPPVGVTVLLSNAAGNEAGISLGTVRWKEWWVMHRRLTPEQLALFKTGAVVTGIQVTGGRNQDDRVLYFDNLCFFEEQAPPLHFEPRPTRGVAPFPGQTAGTNTGPGKLPFPTHDRTILPDNLTDDFAVQLTKSTNGYEFHYRGKDGHLVYEYRPATGTLSDVTATWTGQDGAFKPLVDGGVYFQSDDSGPAPPDTAKLLRCEQVEQTVVSAWECSWKGQKAEVTYTLRLWQKSLVIDVRCVGGQVSEFRVGKAVGVGNPRLVTLPFLACDQQRPAVLITGPPERPLFVSAFVDHCRSNGSQLWAVNQVDDDGTVYSGGSRYLPKTDGRRNDCFERLFLNVSPRFEEVLPNVPNPKSPWMHVAGERLWRAHGASNRESDFALWKKVARYGMTKVVITDHETGWRDGGESFTLRTSAAPKKGGDPAQAEYARKIRALGFRYGIYNNYTDFAPVNEHWDEDSVARLPDGEWRPAWPRCYNLKPSRAVELEAKLAPIIQDKFHLDTAYCDVHTAVTPWNYCDYDARVPGAGTFAATFYAYGEIMLHQKRTWNGPVYSEGNNHWYYCGLTDGNYGQDQRAHLAKSPWLVDFDLRKLHPLCCNFGMGSLSMFFGRHEGLGSTPAERERRLDQFLAATLAFGHTGFLVLEGGMANAVRSYFNLQQVHANYAQDTVDHIRYADQGGNLLDTSAAVATGAFKRSQIVTTYAGGMKVVVNGHPSETWRTADAELPPFGWYAADRQSAQIVAFSALVDGHRADYVESPAYVYADGRGQFTRFERAACDGQLIAHRHPDGTMEVIPLEGCSSFAVSLDGKAALAVALTEDGATMGPAETRLSRGLVSIIPVSGAFSYLLTPEGEPATVLQCPRQKPVPGETVTVTGEATHRFRVPAETQPGSRLWRQFEDCWIDFTVAPLVTARLRIDSAAHLELTLHTPSAIEARIELGDHTRPVMLAPRQAVRVEFPYDVPRDEQVQVVPLHVTAGDLDHAQQWWLKAEKMLTEAAALPESFHGGQRLRSGSEEPFPGTSGAYATRQTMACGDVSHAGIFMHPPYKTGVGYSFVLFDAVDLPEQPKAAFRCQIGKRDGSDPGDGILFRVAVVGAQGIETVVVERQWIKHAWTPIEANLAAWTGQCVQIKLISDVGPADNSSGDWACWADMRIESADPVLLLTVHDRPVQLQFESGPSPLPGLTLQRLKGAKSGRLHFQGIGLQCGGQYVSHATLNGVALGPLPNAGGNEAQGIWGDAVLPLTPQAIAALEASSHLEIVNPGQDCFKIRRVWLELELADGKKCSSKVTTATTTQPSSWLHAEGTGVPFGENIDLEIRFPCNGNTR